MKTYHHKPIKRFSLSGNIHDDAVIDRLRQEYIRLLKIEMKLTGYAPRLDIDSDFTISYNTSGDYFEFELSLYGVYVGKKQSECLTGIDISRPVYMQESRSKESSLPQESKLPES